MNTPIDFPARYALILMASAGGILAITLALMIVLRRRRKTPEEIERLRRLAVNRRGRITQGQIVDLLEPQPGKPGPRMVVFIYEIAGVKYEAAQDISALPGVIAQVRRGTGSMANVKYDFDRPTNSIIACEEWSGVTS